MRCMAQSAVVGRGGVQYNGRDCNRTYTSAGLLRYGCKTMDSQETAADEPGGTGTDGRRAEDRSGNARSARCRGTTCILWDSDDHSYEYVERMLRELFGHTQEECHKMAETVDTRGQGDRAHDDQGARRAEARPDHRLRQRRPDEELQRLDALDDRIGRLRGKAEGGGGKARAVMASMNCEIGRSSLRFA